MVLSLKVAYENDPTILIQDIILRGFLFEQPFFEITCETTKLYKEMQVLVQNLKQ